MHPPLSSSSVHDDLLNALFRATTDFVFMKDMDGCYVTVNAAGARLLGMSPEEIAGKDDYALFPHEIADHLVEQDRQVMELGVPISYEEQIPFAKTVLHLHTVKSPWRDASGAIMGIVGVARDISARICMEQELQKTKSRFSKLFASDLMGIHLPDRFGAIVEANDEFLRITGYTRADLEAGLVRWDIMTPPEYRQVDEAHIAEAAERGSCTPYEKEYVRKDGTRVPIMCGYALLEDSQDNYIAFIQDLSALKQSEQAVLQAEKLNTAGRFAASMAHEINNPLAAVINLAYLASHDEKLDASTRTLLREADHELARVARVVTQTLRFHKQSTFAGMADVKEILESVFPLFASQLRARHITLHRAYREVPKLLCYQHELRHAFANLAGNALDAMQTKGGALRVRLRQGHRWGGDNVGGIVVTIADTGTGIAPVMRDRMFEPFVTTKEQIGTGLGLWATKNIVGKHHGHIRFRTAIGAKRHGTVFRIFLPLNGIPRAEGQDS
uniref:histidine kinase n=1 Tax=Acidobacterium capsulatum TaxID=33075 RepID=A0A7V4XRM0_9BACT